ncbi:Uncharacterised protein [Legionella spiritensis]|nr:Uncharacterised protein [Legionella spiritensis]
MAGIRFINLLADVKKRQDIGRGRIESRYPFGLSPSLVSLNFSS